MDSDRTRKVDYLWEIVEGDDFRLAGIAYRELVGMGEADII